jgi:hypothetical protein
MGTKLSGIAPALRGGASMGTCALLACIMFSCGDDDDAANRCAGADEISCTCENGDKGTAQCDDDGGAGECQCDGDASAGGSGGSGTSGSGASGSSSAGSSASGSGASGSSASGSGGSAGSEDDGGAEPAADSGMPPTMMPPPNIPMDGNQLAGCDDDRDCNMNLGCYAPDNGGFCSRVCEGDEECASLMGAEYHCSQTGVCAVECANADDDDSCPGDLQCVAVGGGGDQGGGGDVFRCLYPPAMDPEVGAFAECGGGGGGDGNNCMDGLNCVGDNGGNPGFCSHACTPQDQDCSDVAPPSGTITASCVPQGPENGVCALDCEAMPAGCPTGMECVEQGFYSLCRYMD